VQDGKINWADAGGTNNVITATYSPPLTALVDGQECYVRAGFANSTTTPTFSPDGLTARVITKNGNAALAAGDIAADGHELHLRYRLSDTKWELLNPAVTGVPTISGTNSFTGVNNFSNTVNFTNAANFAKGADIASASTTNIWAATGNVLDVTGTTGITSFGTAPQAGARKLVRFTGVLTITAGANVVLPTSGNITTAAGDYAIITAFTTTVAHVMYFKKDGTAVALPVGTIVDRSYTEYTANTSLSTVIPRDDTIPQNTEGTQIFSVSFTPKSTTNRLRIRMAGFCAGDASVGTLTAALFINAGVNAVKTTSVWNNATNTPQQQVLEYEFVPASVSSQTLAIRAGPNAGTMRYNGTTIAREYGGTASVTLIIEEIVA
jgi:hypothetical protein